MNRTLEAIGLIVIQSSHLESEIESLCTFFIDLFPRDEVTPTSSTKKKIEWMLKAINELDSDDLKPLTKKLDNALNLLTKRNNIVHGNVYITGLPNQLTCYNERAQNKEIVLNDDKLFKLADDIYNCHNELPLNTTFKLLSAIHAKIA